MLCNHCGKDLPEGAAFCPSCGKAQEAPQALSVPEEPAPGGKKRKKIWIVVLAALLVLALATAALAAGGLFGSPEGRLMAAVANSVQAYTEAVEQLNLPDTEALEEADVVQQQLRVVLKQLPDMDPAFSGVGVELITAADLQNQKLRIDLGLLLEEEQRVASALLFAQGDVIALGSPEIMDDTYLGINTTTLGADLVNLLGYDEGFGELSFNLFELMDETQAPAEGETVPEPDGTELVQAIQVSRGERKQLQINGRSVKCAGYEVVIPADALVAFLRELVQAASHAASAEEMRAVLEDIGLGADALDEELLYSPVDEVEEALDELAEKLQDLKLEVYLSDGYVMALLGELELSEEAVRFAFYFGGGERYTDDLSFEIAGEEETVIRFASAGDHAGLGGAITDRSELVVQEHGETELRLLSELRYEPGKTGENFSWRLDGLDDFAIEARGSLALGRDAVKLDLQELGLRIDGERVALAVCYDVAVSQAVQIPDAEVQMILTMDEGELYELGLQIGLGAAAFLEQVVSDYPQLEALLYAFY